MPKVVGGRTFPEGGIHVNSHNALRRCENLRHLYGLTLTPLLLHLLLDLLLLLFLELMSECGQRRGHHLFCDLQLLLKKEERSTSGWPTASSWPTASAEESIIPRKVPARVESRQLEQLLDIIVGCETQ